MKIKTISVSAGRTFNHPHEHHSNLRPEVILTAEILDSEDAVACARQLQMQAEGLVDDHTQAILRSLEELYKLTERQAEMQGLKRELERAQLRLEAIRKDHPEIDFLEEGGKP